MTFSEKVFETGIVPVVMLNNVDDAVPIAGALLKGGIDFMEITFRTECAAECISVISKEVPDMTVGAGTVLNVEQAKLAVDKAYRETLGEEGRKEACQRYRISKKVDQLEEILQSLVSRG